jgi:hypothetical protein
MSCLALWPKSARQSSFGQLLSREVNSILSFLVRQPLDEFLHTSLQRDLRVEAKKLLGPTRICVAVPDVA